LKRIKTLGSSGSSEESLYEKYKNLDSLLDPASPYYEDFLPIYELYKNSEIHDLD